MVSCTVVGFPACRISECWRW